MPGETPTNPASQRTSLALPCRGESMHEDLTVKWFMFSSIAYFFVVGIVALTMAAKFVWPRIDRHACMVDLRAAAAAACEWHAVRLAPAPPTSA